MLCCSIGVLMKLLILFPLHYIIQVLSDWSQLGGRAVVHSFLCSFMSTGEGETTSEVLLSHVLSLALSLSLISIFVACNVSSEAFVLLSYV